MRIYDLSVPISQDLVRWPEDPGPSIQRVLDLDTGDPMTVSRLEMGAHTGTHIDAPSHFLRDARDVADLDLGLLVGPASVVDTGNAAVISRELLQAMTIPAGTERVLFRTTSSRYWGDPEAAFRDDYVALTPSAAQELVDLGVKLVGIDYLSVDPPIDESPAHLIFMKAGVVIVETLDLRDVPAGEYFLACLPLRIPGAEAAPARVVLVELDGEVADE